MAQNKFIAIFLRILLIFALLAWFYPQPTYAAGPLTALSDTMSRLQKSPVYSDHTIKFTTPTGVAAGKVMEITFPSGFTIGSVDNTDIDVSWGATYENELTLAGTCSGSTWGAAFTGQVLAITSCTGTITGASKVMIEIGQNATGGGANLQIQNHATAATYTISIGGDFGDTGKIAIVILDNDQFTVSATVDPTITLGLSATSTAFGTLGTSVKTSDPVITLTVSTNSNSGYTITVQDEGDGSDPGLYKSVGGAYTIVSDSVDLNSVAGYGIQCFSASAICQSPYDVSGTNVGGYERTAQSFATRNGTADGQTITITSKAKVTGSTPAGSYNDTVTVIATGNF